MNARSGVFTTYLIDFVNANFKVSNDVSAISAGDFLLDADVTVTMGRDTAGTTFTITVYNLPQNQLDALDAAISPKNYQQSVKIQLGYFETKALLVVDGIYEKIESKVAADSTTGQNRLVTTISGKERALRACSDAKYSCTLSDDSAGDPASAAKSVLLEVTSDRNKKDHPGIDKLVDTTVQITGALTEKTATTFNSNSILTVLSEIASKAKAELLVVDGKVYLGAPIKYDPDPPGASGITLDPTVNLAQFSKVKVNVKPKTNVGTKTPAGDQASAPTDSTIRAFTFTALGDPTMRPGQKVTPSGLQAPTFSGLKSSTVATEFRVNTVTHQLSGSGGYICTGDAVDAANATAARESIKPSAAGGAQDVASAIKSEAGKNPVIEVTSIIAASDKAKYPYQVDLYYGQQRKDEQQPSIEAAVVPDDNCHVYRHRPIASPFAWRKCGLVTPVYPVMKALLAHSAGLATDGIVTGYIWSKLPDMPPPPNEPGDWWLSLPIDVNATSLLPTDAQLTEKDDEGKPKFDWAKFDWSKFDQTKAVNDLMAGNGHRVIEVKGLKISVGAGKLATVGTRPNEGPDDDFLIEHASGTSIHIDSNGALTIDASKVSLTIKGDVVIQGSLEIK